MKEVRETQGVPFTYPYCRSHDIRCPEPGCGACACDHCFDCGACPADPCDHDV
ncbi:hypothetical protein JHN59_05665 [Streptomyces sp. MBT49]|uniref:hypothetical protein n=1 Tax=Streptomyces sp. MBT49 TaxID=1488380 RepID=UPI00190ACDED|nr:hypothetical protein [Streptomyces sp. MBT49]MBK3624335.1 hypothetical protein [Streptomyces sp. MBT49]